MLYATLRNLRCRFSLVYSTSVVVLPVPANATILITSPGFISCLTKRTCSCVRRTLSEGLLGNQQVIHVCKFNRDFAYTRLMLGLFHISHMVFCCFYTHPDSERTKAIRVLTWLHTNGTCRQELNGKVPCLHTFSIGFISIWSDFKCKCKPNPVRHFPVIELKLDWWAGDWHGTWCESFMGLLKPDKVQGTVWN